MKVPALELVRFSPCKTKKKIYQYSMDGKFVREWSSILEASKSLSIPVGNITKTIQGIHRVCYGYYFTDKSMILEPYVFHHPLQKKIKVIDLTTGDVTFFKGKREMTRVLNINRASVRYALENNNGLMSKLQLKLEEI